MAYIVDFTIIMHRLSEIEISEECVVSTLKYNDICKFSTSRISGPRLSTMIIPLTMLFNQSNDSFA